MIFAELMEFLQVYANYRQKGVRALSAQVFERLLIPFGKRRQYKVQGVIVSRRPV
jgi:hypothetical protein